MQSQQPNPKNTNTKIQTWLDRAIPKVKTADDNEPHTTCKTCKASIKTSLIAANYFVCTQCDAHLVMSARQRLHWFFDHSNTEHGQNFTSHDPLGFVDSKPYVDRLQQAKEQTGESEALLVVKGILQDMPLVACAFDFTFMGGSMGSVVGDRFVEACDVACAEKLPLVCFAASGGARMQEGLLSLMQMARTAAAIQKLKDTGLPYIVVLTHPVYGGVTASLAMLGDIHIAEPKAMIGFAGKRVIEQTVREKLDEPFQRGEFLQQKGVIDMIVHRHDLKKSIYRLLAKLTKFK